MLNFERLKKVNKEVRSSHIDGELFVFKIF